jgi:hypothetical protein
MTNIAVITTFGDDSWDVYAKRMIESYVQYWPQDIPLMVQLDDDLLYEQVNKILPEHFGIFVGRTKEHQDFVDRNKDKDHPTDYRKQAVRFCHKVFAIYHTLESILKAKAAGAADIPRYLIWMDADVITTRAVTLEDIQKCLPKEGDAVAYLGRKDWDHSECGWLAFDLEHSGDLIINNAFNTYSSDALFGLEQWHDSWVWDRLRMHATALNQAGRWTNLTEGKPGTEIWQQSPMALWSTHYKGPVAKQRLYQQPKPIQPTHQIGSNFAIQTKNAIPNEQICSHIEQNQVLIQNWVRECTLNKETLAVVSAGPLLIPEDLQKEVDAGIKIVAVKHALKPLREAGIKPWACILLDPRPHVADFVTEADKDVIWFVASQVNPAVTKSLLDQGCTVWGYHASVGADEQELTAKQPGAVISGGSATATRGLYLLRHLGFKSFHLYGYELSHADKPNMDLRDELGQPKYMEFSLTARDNHINFKKSFYSEPQLIAQYQELNDIITRGDLSIKAFGEGMIPFIVRCKGLVDLRKAKINGIIPQTSYRKLLWKTKKSSPAWRKAFSIIRPKLKVKNR